MPVWGTCAGMILLAKEVIDERPHLGLMDIAVRVTTADETERFPPEDERFTVLPGLALPLLRLSVPTPDPLAVLGVFRPELWFR